MPNFNAEARTVRDQVQTTSPRGQAHIKCTEHRRCSVLEAVRDLVATYVEDIASRRGGASVDQWMCLCKKTLTGSFGRNSGHLIGEKYCGLVPCTASSKQQIPELKDLAGGLRKAKSL